MAKAVKKAAKGRGVAKPARAKIAAKKKTPTRKPRAAKKDK
jgi:hypothetical protein